MMPVGLFVVFVISKAAVLSRHGIAPSAWSPFVYLWQDALVAVAFGAITWRLPKRAAQAIYCVLALYTALNIPVERAVSTPLTWPMLQAARGPLADSILLYVTWTNAAWVLVTLAAAALMPRVVRQPSWPAAAVSIVLIVTGLLAHTRVDTSGLERNAILTLVSGALPRVGSKPSPGDWRASDFTRDGGEDLTRFRGGAKGRNIVLVGLESTAAQYLSLYGGEYNLSPNLTALANNGIVFDNAYAAYPESIKGLFSVLCATFPAFDSRTDDYASAPCNALPEALRQAGYHTAMFHSGRFGYLGMEAAIRNRGFLLLEDAGDIGGNHESSFGIDEPATVDRALKWIDSIPRGDSFFLTYLPIAGHHPYETPSPGPFPEHDELGRYRNAVLYGDASLGTLIEGIRARGLAENKLWIIYGDHGEAFGQHEGNYGHTFFLYEENVHVPLVIASPGMIRRQIRATTVMSLVDIAPTVFDLLGLPPQSGVQGESALNGQPRMALFFADYSLGLLGLRDGRYKYIYDLGSGRAKMFDLVSDPRETRDVSLSHREAAEWYKTRVQSWTEAQKSYLEPRR